MDLEEQCEIIRNKIEKIGNISKISRETGIGINIIIRFSQGKDIKMKHFIKIRDFFENLDKNTSKE